jgi:hypothetical protein
VTTEQNVKVRGGRTGSGSCSVLNFGIGVADPSFSGTTGFIT